MSPSRPCIDTSRRWLRPRCSLSSPNVVADPVGYRTTAVYADEEDVRAVTGLFAKVLEPLVVEAEGKQRILISTVVVPN